MVEFHETKNPWLGLSSYKYEDSNRFYGRDKELRNLSEIIRRNSFTTIYGLSGAGKTSIINAGLSPILEKENYLPIYIRLNHNEDKLSYDSQIINAVERALNNAGGESESIFDIDINCEDDRLWMYFHSHRFWTSDNHKLIPILFIDQFEEIFTKNENPETIWSFFNIIDSLQYNIPTGRVLSLIEGLKQHITFCDDANFRLVFSMREDFLPRLEDYCYDIPALRRNRVGLKPLNGIQALEVITKPSPDLVSRDVALHIISKVIGKKIEDNQKKLETIQVETSILSLFCSELYNFRNVDVEYGKITKLLVDSHGSNILELYYNRNIQMLPERSSIYLENQLLTHSGYRNSVALEDLLANGLKLEQVETLAENRIVRIEEINHILRVEFTHDVLCQIAKSHRDKRVVHKENRKTNLENTIWGIETSLLLLSVFAFIYLLQISDRLFISGRGSLLINLTEIVIGFIILFFDIFPFTKNKSHRDKTILLSILFISTIILSHIIYVYRRVWVLDYLLFGIYLYQISTKKNSQKFKIILRLVLTISWSILGFVVSPILLLIIPIISNFVITPYRFYKFHNTVFYILMIIINIISNILIISLFLLPETSLNYIIRSYIDFNFHLDLTHGIVLLLLAYPLSYLLFIKNKQKCTLNDSINYCISFTVYKERRFFITFIKCIAWILFFTLSIAAGISLNDKYSAINILAVGLGTFYLLKNELNINNRLVNNFIDKKIVFIEPIALSIILILIIIQQYIPYGILLYIAIIIVSAYLIKKIYILNNENRQIKVFISKFLLLIVPLFIIPSVSIGYNQFSLFKYARVYKGTLSPRTYTKFLKITDCTGRIGVRDRNNLVIPAEYQDASYTIIDIDSYDFLDEIFSSHNSNYDIRDKFNLPEISFILKTISGEKKIWKCSEHLDMDNRCTYLITTSHLKKFERFNNNKYIDYLLSQKLVDKKKISEIVTNGVDNNLSTTYPEYAIYYFFQNLEYIKYIEKDSFDYITKLFNDRLPSIINKLNNEYNKDRLLIECSYYQLLYGDSIGAENNLRSILQDSKSINTRISANRVLCFLYLITHRYSQAETIIDQFKNSEEPYFANHNREFYRKDHQFDGTICFIDAIRKDIEKIKTMDFISERYSPDYNAIDSYLASYPIIPLYDYSINYFNENSKTNKDKFNDQYRLCIKCLDKPLYEESIDYEYMFIVHNDQVVTPRFIRFSKSNDVDNDIITIIRSDNYKRCFFSLKQCKMLEGEFDKAWRFSEGHAFVVQNKKMYIIDKSCKIVSKDTIPYNYEFNESKHYMYGTKGLYINNHEPDHIFKNGTCEIVNEDSTYGLIDYNGNWILEPSYADISRSLGDEGYRVVRTFDDYFAGVIDKNGRLIIDIDHQIFVGDTNFSFDGIHYDNFDKEENLMEFIAHIKSYASRHKVKHPNNRWE